MKRKMMANAQVDRLEKMVEEIKKDKNHGFACVITTKNETAILSHGNSVLLMNFIAGCGHAVFDGVASLGGDKEG